MGIFPTACAASVCKKTPLERQIRPVGGRLNQEKKAKTGMFQKYGFSLLGRGGNV